MSIGHVISRKFSMPNHNTFEMDPVKELLAKYVLGDPNLWIDPFARNSEWALATNDINPDTTAQDHMNYDEFLTQYIGQYVEGVLLDPPYSPRQIKECYDSFGLKMSQNDSHGFYSNAWKLILQIGPKCVIQFGWHTNGNVEHYELIELLIVNHGGQHNDTLCSVWKKKNHSLEEFL